MTIELRLAGSAPAHVSYTQVSWDVPGTPSGIDSSLDGWLSQLGEVSDEAIDFARLASAAYIADRLNRRGVTFSRSIAIHVQLLRPAVWTPLLPRMERLLSWISADKWQISISQDGALRPANMSQMCAESGTYTDVMLLSGGLDSFCGALLADGPRLFVSHSDNPTVTASQNRVWTWLAGKGVTGERVRIPLCESATKLENTTRSRALLFYALAIAVADSRRVGRVTVPENGFTSLNLSLGNDRGGALSTRSTHPWTMHLVQQLLVDAGIGVKISNPFELLTKGELVKRAHTCNPFLSEGLVETLSCAKLDGARYRGGNPNRNCGLCVACVTRRAAVLAAGLDDKTPYLATTLAGAALGQLRARRLPDLQALLTRVDSDVDEFVLLENGPYPDSYDLTAGADLCRRGFAELAAVLPGLA